MIGIYLKVKFIMLKNENYSSKLMFRWLAFAREMLLSDTHYGS